MFEGFGLIVAIVGAVIMSIGTDYIIQPLFYPKKQGRQPLLTTVEVLLAHKSHDVEDPEISKSKFFNQECYQFKFILFVL